ncbi:MAG TPA: glycoside hydrolase family 20 zincin-like fold domain-containing protein, partial [Armatimonadota bacterium]
MKLSTDLNLAPVPKRINHRKGIFNPEGKLYIKLEAENPSVLIPAVRKTGLGWQVTASPKAPRQQVGLTIRLACDSDIRAEGYDLAISPEHMEITAADPAGAYYGACTLAQILRQCGGDGICGFGGLLSAESSRKLEIPCLSISDWPDL